LNATSYQQSNDTNNNTNAYLGQDLLIRTQFVLANNLTSEACYSLIFQFSITAATNDAAYFTNGFFISSGDNLMCMKSQALPILSRYDQMIVLCRLIFFIIWLFIEVVARLYTIHSWNLISVSLVTIQSIQQMSLRAL